MNKNYIVMTLVIGLVVLAGLGYAAWTAFHPSQVPVQTPTDTTTTQTPADTTSVPQSGAPIVQTDSVTAPYISTVVVKGTVNPNGELTSYWYEYGQTSNLGTKTIVYLVGSGFAKIYTPAYITGLQSNTNYYFRLSARNSLGTVNGATYSFKTNTTPVPTGSIPATTTQNATDITTVAANLQGKVNPNGSTTTFWFEYGLSANLGAVTSFQSIDANKSSSTISIAVSGLRPATKYYFRLNAQNEFGVTNGSILNFTTKGPALASAPTVSTISATSVAASSAKLSGSVNPNGAATTYLFEYGDNSLLSNPVASTTTEQSLSAGTSAVNVSANINNLHSNTTYYYSVVAKNQYGVVRGEVKSFTTKK